MKVTALVLNDQGEPHYRQEAYYNVEGMIKVAETREAVVREAGANNMANIITSSGKEYVKSVNTGEYDDMDKALANLTMMLWLFDTVCVGIDIETMCGHNFDVTIADNGAVKFTRIPAGE